MTTSDPGDGRMRRVELIHQVASDLTGWKYLTILRIVVALSLGFAATAYTTAELARSEIRFEQAVNSGLFTWRVAGLSGPARIDASRCDALRNVVGVEAAGGVLNSEQVSIETAPNSNTVFSRVTPGYLEVIAPLSAVQMVSNANVYVGSYTAQTLGLVTGGQIRIGLASGTQSAEVAGVLAPSLRLPTADRRIYSITPPSGELAECWVSANPANADGVRNVLTSWFPAATNVAPFSVSTTDPADLLAEFHSRISAWVWVASYLLVAGSTAMTWRLRRSEIAIYQLMRIGRGRIATMELFDFLATTLAPYLTGALLAIAASQTLTPLGVDTVRLGLLAAALLVIASMPLFFRHSFNQSTVDALKS